MHARGIVCGVALGALATALVAPQFAPSGSNCGGNSAALAQVRAYVILVEGAASENADGSFSITSATPQQREVLSRIADDIWIGPGRYLVSVRPYELSDQGPPYVVIVCNKPFTNVPRRAFGLGEPRHAAAYSDGTVVLLSESEYAAIHPSSLVLLDDLVLR